MPSSPVMEHESTIDNLKKRAAAYLSDLYNATSASSSSCPDSPLTEDDLSEDNLMSKKGKKRSYSQYSPPSALELLTQSAAKKLALASGDLPTPLISDEDFLAQAGALLASANNSMFHFDYYYYFS